MKAIGNIQQEIMRNAASAPYLLHDLIARTRSLRCRYLMHERPENSLEIVTVSRYK